MKLIIEDDEGRKTVIPVVRDEITIGRNERNLIRLAEKNVSRKPRTADPRGRPLLHRGPRQLHRDPRQRREDRGQAAGATTRPDPDQRVRPDPAGRARGEAARRTASTPREEKSAATSARRPRAAAARAAGGAARKPEPEVVAAPPIDAEADGAGAPSWRRPRPSGSPTCAAQHGEHPGAGRAGERGPRWWGSRDIPGQEFCSTAARSASAAPTRTSWRSTTPRSPQALPPAPRRRQLEGDGRRVPQRRAGQRRAVRAIALRHGDVVEIGHLSFAFVERGKALPAALGARAAGRGAARLRRARRHRGLDRHRDGECRHALRGRASTSGYRGRGGVRRQAEGRAHGRAPRAGDALAAHRYTEGLRNLEDRAAARGQARRSWRTYASSEREARSEDMYREMEGAVATQDWETRAGCSASRLAHRPISARRAPRGPRR